MEELVYQLLCEMCEVSTTIVVYDQDEKPAFCPMCGSEWPEDN